MNLSGVEPTFEPDLLPTGMITSILEEVIGFCHGQDQFNEEIQMFSPNNLRIEDLRSLGSIFSSSLNIFKFGKLRDLVGRLFLYTDLKYFSSMIKKHADTIADITEKQETLFDIWNVYLDGESRPFHLGCTCTQKWSKKDLSTTLNSY